MKKIVLIDSHALLHRAFHALPGFATSKGKPSGAIFGFIKMILKIKEELKPDYVIATFDRKEATFRHEAYDDYKINRGKTDDSLIEQIIFAPEVCKALNIPVYSLAGFEADDLLGTIVEYFKKNNFETKINNQKEKVEIFIASGDMDTMQLVDKDSNVRIYTLKKGIGETIIYKYQDILKRFSFTAEQIPDYKGLRGDTSDNIKGIAGIGEKTATTILNLFQNIENLYKIIHQDKEEFIKICKAKKEYKLTDRIINLIIDGEEDAVFSKTLATIRKDAKINFLLPKEKWLENWSDQEFKKICEEYEFKSLKNYFQTKDVEEHLKNFQGVDLSEIQNENSNQKNNLIKEGDLQELKIMTNLLNSEKTNPKLEDIQNENAEFDIEKLKNLLQENLKKENLWNLYQEVEFPLIKILQEIKINGIKVDKKILEKQSLLLHTELENLEKEIFNLAGEEFNVASPKQLAIILYEKLKITNKIKKTAGGKLTTNMEQLEKMKDLHPIIEKIIKHREISKLLSTYIDTLPNFIEKDEKIHPEFIQTGASTGRFACENPNLQNLPVKSEEGILIRKAFIASSKYKFLSIDYSQIDLRSAAILSKDKNLIEIFQKNLDIHTGVAAKIFKIKEDMVDKEMRRKAKSINFGILYGMGINSLKESMGVERKEAQEFFEEYKKTFSTLINYLEKVKLNAFKNGYTETLLKRRRHIPLLKSGIPFLKAQGERIAINAPFQGTSSDILKLGMIDVEEYIKKNKLEDKIKILLQIHDELILEIDENIIDKEKENLKKILENVLIKRYEDKIFKNIFLEDIALKDVPIKADAKIGDNLFELK